MIGDHTVRLLNVPSTLFVQNVVLLEDLLHEIHLVQVGHDTGQAPIPPELATRLRQVFDSYAATRQAMCEQAERAVAAGQERLDLDLCFPRNGAPSARDLATLTDQADAVASELDLLTVPAPPEVVELRRWISDQIESQLERGEAPEPFEDPAT